MTCELPDNLSGAEDKVPSPQINRKTRIRSGVKAACNNFDNFLGTATKRGAAQILSTDPYPHFYYLEKLDEDEIRKNKACWGILFSWSKQ